MYLLFIKITTLCAKCPFEKKRDRMNKDWCRYVIHFYFFPYSFCFIYLSILSHIFLHTLMCEIGVTATLLYKKRTDIPKMTPIYIIFLLKYWCSILLSVKRIKKYKFDKKYIYLNVKDLNVIYDTKETARESISHDCIFLLTKKNMESAAPFIHVLKMK